jgi:hypothetical protein
MIRARKSEELMRLISTRYLPLAVLTATMMLAGCPKGGVPGSGDLPGGGKVPGGIPGGDCGEYATNDAGRKIKAFLDATKQLDATVKQTVDVVGESCRMMGQELQMSAGDLDGDTKTVCNKVIATIKDNLKVAIKPKAKLKIDYKPAVCTVDISATAKAAAECEAKAEADVKVRCEGSCSGTCNGTCNGNCAGKAGTGGSGGQCNGQCEGTCEGSCSGGCEGSADVEASAECRASAEVKASADVQCTEPELNIEADAKIIVDKAKAEMTIAALKRGLPKLLSVQARMRPLGAAFKTWAKSVADLKGVVGDLKSALGDAYLCVSAQLTAAFGMLPSIQVNVEVSVEVSASASGSAGI